MALRCEHWDNFPEETVFFVRRIPEGPDQGLWGIEGQHPGEGPIWVALGSPLKLVVALSPEMAQRDLTKLCKSTAMREAAEISGKDADSRDLPDPRTFPNVQWDEVPESARLQERQFRGEIWGIMAEMPDGEHLVIFDGLAQDAGYLTYSANQKGALLAISFLELNRKHPDSDSQVGQHLRDVASTPPDLQPNVEERLRTVLSDLDEREHFGEILVAINEVAEKDRGRIADLEKEWRRRLEAGNRKSCLCGQCRHEIRRKVVEILEWYEESMGYVPEELRLDSLRLLDLLAK